MKEKLAALDHIIELCEKSIAKPYKDKRMVIIAKDDEKSSLKGRIDSDSEDAIDKKSKISSMLEEMDEEDLIRLYESLEG